MQLDRAYGELDRVYRDYSALENFVVRVMMSCESIEQFEVAKRIHKRAKRIVEEYHPSKLSEYNDKINLIMMMM